MYRILHNYYPIIWLNYSVLATDGKERRGGDPEQICTPLAPLLAARRMGECEIQNKKRGCLIIEMSLNQNCRFFIIMNITIKVYLLQYH